MRIPRRLGWTVALAAACAAAGCSDSRALRREADAACLRLTRADRAGDGAASGARADPRAAPAAPVLYFAPREASDVAAGQAAPAAEKAPEKAADPAPPQDAAAPFASIQGLSAGDIIKSDLKQVPSKLWSGTKHSFADPLNLAILGAAFGADRIVRHNLDSDVRDRFRDDDSSLAETGDFGSVIGNPALHFGLAGAWYLAAVHNRDAKNHELSKTMIEALAINGMATGLLKVSMDDRSPNDEYWGWPSGHMSSSICFASVIQEYYGWPAAVPLYLLAGYSGATRLEDREHDLSDLVFGAALGWVIGHSVVKGELPQVAGFHVLPYGGPQAGGLMLLKRW